MNTRKKIKEKVQFLKEHGCPTNEMEAVFRGRQEAIEDIEKMIKNVAKKLNTKAYDKLSIDTFKFDLTEEIKEI